MHVCCDVTSLFECTSGKWMEVTSAGFVLNSVGFVASVVEVKVCCGGGGCSGEEGVEGGV